MRSFPTAGKERRDRKARRLATVVLGTLQFLVKKLREQRSWKVKKSVISGGFEFCNYLKIIEK
jgi:hypothetical protein